MLIMDYNLLFTNLNRYSKISEADFSQISAVLTKRFVKKKRALISEGDTCRYIFFVEKGIMRSFSTDKDGGEHVMQLAIEDHWIADLSSFITQTAGTLTVEAIEDSEVLLLPYAAIDQLCERLPQLEKYFRRLYQSAYVSMQQRYNGVQSKPAKERYELLIRDNPKFAARIPLIHIASYLGITAESLSRIRKQVVTFN
jgi:CRP-like cAMP-binding protein